MGCQATKLLLALLEAPRAANNFNSNGHIAAITSPVIPDTFRIKMPTNLIVRASCGASQRATIL
jgi:LacI family transcriptional regulator